MKTLPRSPVSQVPIPRLGSLKDLAYQDIKRKIVSGQLQLSQIYSAQYFAEQLGVSPPRPAKRVAS